MRFVVRCAVVIAVAIGLAAVFILREATPRNRGLFECATNLPFGIAHATEQYYKRGGCYIWGKNDCSMFLTDYLKAHDVQFSRRLTTKEFADVHLMRSLGLKKVSGKLKPGDIVVYRFHDGRDLGHCGVIILKDGELDVVHNSGSMGGIAVSSYEAFVARAQEFGTSEDQILAYRPIG